MAKRVYVGDYKIRHTGCYSESLEGLPDVEFTMVETKEVPREGYFRNYFIYSSENTPFEQIREKVLKHPVIRDFQPVDRVQLKEGCLGLAYVEGCSKKTLFSLYARGLEEVRRQPNVVSGGLEHIRMISTRADALKDMYYSLQTRSDVHFSKHIVKDSVMSREHKKQILIKQLEDLGFFDAIFDLTEKQAESLSLAAQSGGYRGRALSEASRDLGVARATNRKRLDAALQKILPPIAKIIDPLEQREFKKPANKR